MRLTSTPLGDRALLFAVGDTADAATNARVHVAAERIRALAHDAITDIVPSFTSVAVHYDPARLSAERLAALVGDAVANAELVPRDAGRVIEIPVRYGGTCGPDLDEVARLHALAPDDVVRLHTAAEYRVQMLGFLPGFPYLAGLDAQLDTPRRATPRERVPAGSVGIGGAQTGVYPLESPGGWQLIGRTTLQLFDARREPPALLRPGDRVRFIAVSASAVPDEVVLPDEWMPPA